MSERPRTVPHAPRARASAPRSSTFSAGITRMLTRGRGEGRGRARHRTVMLLWAGVACRPLLGMFGAQGHVCATGSWMDSAQCVQVAHGEVTPGRFSSAEVVCSDQLDTALFRWRMSLPVC